MINIHTVAIARGIKSIEGTEGSYSASEYSRVALPFFSGCEGCEATLGPEQAAPSKSGYIRCSDCIGDFGFKTVEEFETWNAANIKGAPLVEGESICRECFYNVAVNGECFYAFCPTNWKDGKAIGKATGRYGNHHEDSEYRPPINIDGEEMGYGL